MLARTAFQLFKAFLGFAFFLSLIDIVIAINGGGPSGITLSALFLWISGTGAFWIFKVRFDRGDGLWPFAPRHSTTAPKCYWPEVFEHFPRLVLILGAVGSLTLFPFAARLSALGFGGLELIGRLLVGVNFWASISILIAYAKAQSDAQDMRPENRKRYVPLSVQRRRARFYENWPNVDGWG